MNSLGLAEKQCLVHCHGSSPDGTDQGQTGPEGKKAFALEAPSRGKSFSCLRGFSEMAEWELRKPCSEHFSQFCDSGQLTCLVVSFWGWVVLGSQQVVLKGSFWPSTLGSFRGPCGIENQIQDFCMQSKCFNPLSSLPYLEVLFFISAMWR